MPGGAIHVDRVEVSGAVVLEPHGVLDVASYGGLRGVLVKAAIEEPRAVIAVLDELEVPDRSAYALFTSVHDQLAQWPGVPLLLVARPGEPASRLREYRLPRFVPVHVSVPEAVAAIGSAPRRRIARLYLPNTFTSAGLARRFVRETCDQWSVTGGTDSAVVIANELVENTLLHTYSAPSLRMELRRGLLTVAVYDEDPDPEAVRAPDATGRRHGLTLVADLARVWGCSPTPSGGKVVWAVLRTGDQVTCPW